MTSLPLIAWLRAWTASILGLAYTKLLPRRSQVLVIDSLRESVLFCIVRGEDGKVRLYEPETVESEDAFLDVYLPE